MDQEKKTERVRYNQRPRMLRIQQSLLNVERLGVLEGITDEKWNKGLDTLKKVIQERSK